MKRTAMVAWSAVLMAGWGWAQGVGVVPAPMNAGDTGLESTADKFEVDQKSGWTTFTGNVKVRTGEYEMKADRVRLHADRGDVQARGNVMIQQRGFGTWSGDYIEYNYKTGKGLTGLGDFKAGEFSVRAHEVTRREDGRYDAEHLQVTTCTNAPGHWHWHVSGHGRYKDNDYVEVFGAVPHLLNVPFAYLPYWFRDIDTHYGFRLVPGYTSKWGAYVLGGYVYNIYASPRDGAELDGTTHVDYRSLRGVAVGQNLHWDLKELGAGKFESYYAWDQDPPNSRQDANWMSDINEERWRFKLRHKADLSPRDQFILRGMVSSDSEVSSDFFDSQNRGESTAMNLVSLEHREHAWATGVTVSGPLNDFYSGVSRLPEGWLNIMPQPLFGTGLNYESQTRAGYLDRDPAKYDNAQPAYKYYPGPWADYNLARVDTAHRLTYPMKFWDALSVVPRAGYRGTYYSETELNNNVYRHSAELGAELSARATGDWDNGYRHVVEPYLDYSYQPTHYDTDENGRVYAFDRFDRSYEWADQFGMDGTWLPYDWHGVRPGVRNLLQKRGDNNRMRTFLDWDVYTGVQIDSGGPLDEEGVRLVGSKVKYLPTSKLDIRAQADWDNEENTVAFVDLSTFYQLTEKVRLGGGYLGRDHALYDYDTSRVEEWNRVKENLIYGGFTHDINETWSYSFYVRYDLRNNDIDEVGGYIQYSLDCLVFHLRTAYVNDYQRIDDISEREDDFRISLMVWLKAENRTPDDEWMTW